MTSRQELKMMSGNKWAFELFKNKLGRERKKYEWNEFSVTFFQEKKFLYFEFDTVD